MSIRAILNSFNRGFLICGLGSINYNQSNFKTAVLYYVLRCTCIFCSLKTVYDGNKVALRYDPELLDSTSFILISCFEFVVIGQVISHMWHLFIDKKLSMVLYKLEKIHETLIKLNVVRPMKVKMNWFYIIGIILNFIAFNIRIFMFIRHNFSKKVQSYISPVNMVASGFLQCFAYCEYILLILYIQWMVYVINEQILKRKLCKSTLIDIHLEVVECLKDINGPIYGISSMMSFVVSNISHIILTAYYDIIFFENKNEDQFVYAIIAISIRLIHVMVLYGVGHATEKEINRMSIVFNQMFVVEKNPRIKRQIKFFILRRLHDHFQFNLYGICHINPRKLLTLSNKAFAYLVIQILFKLNKK